MVKPATAMRIWSSRPCSMPMDEASRATARAPAARIRASVRCMVSTSGVVRLPPSDWPSGSSAPRVPMLPHGLPMRVSTCASHWVHEVLPLVPVIATTLRSCDGRPYHSSASAPSKVRSCATGKACAPAGATGAPSVSYRMALAPRASA
ncbi:Uncharacterised protein [Bordetella pertussis]|nr:Uncharacterised protein [Bordetella pertussis]